MTFSDTDIQYMRRALQLAAAGEGHTSPNPMVGAVIVAPGRGIIGEGWHRRYGGPHAEVNAVRSVAEADRALLPQSTIYVTLEPCSHYGKTPPCALLLRDSGFARVVVGTGDPNPRVAGRGIDMLRTAGIRVDVGLLADECRDLNKCFFTAHTLGRPFVTLKWAQSADGFIDGHISGDLGSMIVHRRRRDADVIVVGAGTVIADNPRLDVRHIDGPSPRPLVLDRHNLLAGSDFAIMRNPRTIHVTDGSAISDILAGLYRDGGYISVLVEGGASVLRGFIDAGLWDEAFVECSPRSIHGKVKAPAVTSVPADALKVGENTVYHYIGEQSPRSAEKERH